jgi:hypothetical protein
MTEQVMSQKAQALELYTEAWDNHAIDRHALGWHPLRTYRIDMPTLTDEFLVPEEFNLDVYIYEQASNAWDDVSYNDQVFIRVCPLEPRPGVLESLAVSSKAECLTEMKRLIELMLGPDPFTDPLYEHGRCEPQGCIIVQRYIDAHASAVMAPGVYDAETGEHTQGYIVMGRDNDGVTAALDGHKIVLPVSGKGAYVRNMWKTLGLDPAVHEVEFVSNLYDTYSNMVEKNNPKALFKTMHTKNFVETRNHIVQLRGCAGHEPINPPPKGVSVQGFVPQGTVEVTDVFYCAGDMEEYSAELEARLRMEIQEGFVISHPDGNSASHAAAQARAYKVPYIIAEVEVGDTWIEPATGWVVNDPSFKAEPYDPVEYVEQYREGLTVGLHHWARMYVHLGHHFHQFAAAPLHDPRTTAFLGGVYTGWLINATLAVSLGEMRHANGQRRGNTPDVYATLGAIFKGKWVDICDDPTMTPPQQRSSYYYTMEKTPLNLVSLHGVFEWLVRMYSAAWSSSYGGTKYKESTQKGQELLLQATKFIGSPIEDNLLSLIEATNTCKNAVHNNGMFFNKFANKSTMDMSTAPDGCMPDLKQMFNTYYAAQAALTKRHVEPELHDASEVLQYVLTRGPATWKKTPIMLDDAAPQVLKDTIDAMFNEGYGSRLHSGGGDFVTPGSHKFVPCGHTKCSTCKEHMNTLETQVQQEYEDELHNLQAELGLQFVDMGMNYEMWPVQPNEGKATSEAQWLVDTLETMKASDSNPDPDELVKCFNIASSLSDSQNNVQTYALKIISKVISRLSVEDRLPLLGKMKDVPVVAPKKITPIELLSGTSKASGTKVTAWEKKKAFFNAIQEQLTANTQEE